MKLRAVITDSRIRKKILIVLFRRFQKISESEEKSQFLLAVTVPIMKNQRKSVK